MTPRQKNRLTLVAIVGIFIAFAVAGRFVDVTALPKDNKGHLIVPHVPIDRLQLTRANSAYGNQDVGHWSLLYIAGSHCKHACKNALFYQMKRTRLSLGRDSHRVQLLVVKTAQDPTLDSFVRQKLPNAISLDGRRYLIEAAMKTALAGEAPFNHVYLVSPDGMIFMWYDSHADKDGTILESGHIYDDVKKTLKGSLTG